MLRSAFDYPTKHKWDYISKRTYVCIGVCVNVYFNATCMPACVHPPEHIYILNVRIEHNSPGNRCWYGTSELYPYICIYLMVLCASSQMFDYFRTVACPNEYNSWEKLFSCFEAIVWVFQEMLVQSCTRSQTDWSDQSDDISIKSIWQFENQKYTYFILE